jgi:mRNA interferase RelE/StbE
MHEIVFTKRSVTDLEKLDDSTKRRILRKLKEYSVSPFDFAHKLSDPTIGSYRFRVGDFRIIFDVNGKNIIVLRSSDR